MRFNRFLLSVLLLCQVILGQKAVAIIDFEPINLGAGEAMALTERFRTEIQTLDNENVYIDRGSMESVLKEQGFQQAGCSSDECAVEVGQLLGAEEIIVGSIGFIGTTYSVNVRQISVESGKILHTASRDFRGEIDYVLTSGMRLIAEQFIGQEEKAPVRQSTAPNSSTDFSQRINDLTENLVPYFNEAVRRTEGPGIYAGNGEIQSVAIRDAKFDVDNQKWIFGAGVASAGCGTCNPVIGFPMVPISLGYSLVGDVQVPANRWQKINGYSESQKTTYIKTYKSQIRRTRFQRALYGSMGGFIIGSVIYSSRKN